MKGKSALLALTSLLLLASCGGGGSSTPASSEAFSSAEASSLISSVEEASESSEEAEASSEEAEVSSEEVSSEADPRIGTSVDVDGFTLYYDPAYEGKGLSVTGYSGTEHKPAIPTVYAGTPVVEIGEEAFLGNESIWSIDVPSSILLIADRAFASCPNLIAVYLPSTVSYLGESICQSDTRTQLYFKITQTQAANKVEEYEFDADFAKGMICQPRFDVSVKPEVVSVGDFVALFDDQNKAVVNYVGSKYDSELTLPTSYGEVAIDAVGTCSFKDMIALTSIAIPEGYKTIGTRAFASCINLETISFPETLKQIYTEAFDGCTSIEALAFPDSLTRINWWSFDGCTSLKSVSFGNSLLSIGHAAFQDCGLTSVTIPDSVTEIDERAFSGNANLATVVLGNGLTTLADNAFADCAFRGGKVYYHGTASEWANVKETYSSNAFAWSDETKTYFYSESEPAEEGLYWHYLDGEPTAWQA
ncbi:MAG: leucine-rich repeat domain-containing protein [Bacilli bacterium]|nr:leucine-rich repeat domain-containing protein [Bacilli bacterium]